MEIKQENIVLSSEDIVIYRGVKAMPFIIGTFGTSSNRMVYLTTVVDAGKNNVNKHYIYNHTKIY
ncbi:hypothetical protein ACOSQ2_029297 [Xanthoceras sorbifolium]